MLDWLRYRYQLALLRKKNRKEMNPHESGYWKAVEQNESQDYRDALWTNLSNQVEINSDRIALLETNYLISEAENHLLPTPDISDAAILVNPEISTKWKRSKHSVQLILTDEGIRELRLALRADRRERLEILRSWVGTIVPGLTGLIGVLIGLLAVILGRR